RPGCAARRATVDLDRVLDRARVHESPRGFSRRAGGGRGDRLSEAAVARRPEVLGEIRGRARAGTHAIFVRADSRGALPSAERRVHDRLYDALRVELHVRHRSTASDDGAHHAAAIWRVAVHHAESADGRAVWDVLAVLQVAVAPRYSGAVARFAVGAR